MGEFNSWRPFWLNIQFVLFAHIAAKWTQTFASYLLAQLYVDAFADMCIQRKFGRRVFLGSPAKSFCKGHIYMSQVIQTPPLEEWH